MKKFIAIFAILSMTIAVPKIVNADLPCVTGVLTCPNGSQYNVVVCDGIDIIFFDYLLCGNPTD